MKTTPTSSSNGCCSPRSVQTAPIQPQTVQNLSVVNLDVSAVRNSGAEAVKTMVRSSYGEVAKKSSAKNSSDCGCGCSTDNPFNLESYENLDGYDPAADLGLGCGIPTELALLEPGNHVLDLGSGGGIDAFIARKAIGESGKVVGVDFTPEMIALAQKNARELGFENVSFVLGDIENLPLESDSFDRILSNCVLNLVPDKQAAFAEMHRVLKTGGLFTVSDIVTVGDLPSGIRDSAAAYAGCVASAIPKDEYISLLEETGFQVDILKDAPLSFTDEYLLQWVGPQELAAFRNSGAQVTSVTLRGKKS